MWVCSSSSWEFGGQERLSMVLCPPGRAGGLLSWSLFHQGVQPWFNGCREQQQCLTGDISHSEYPQIPPTSSCPTLQLKPLTTNHQTLVPLVF